MDEARGPDHNPVSGCDPRALRERRLPDERPLVVEHALDRCLDRRSRAGRGAGTAARPQQTSQLARAVREHAPGPLGEHVRSLAHAPALWFIVCGNPAIVLAIVWNMTVKPGTAGAIGAVVAGYAVGVAVAMFART